jgi:hypothetical protein
LEAAEIAGLGVRQQYQTGLLKPHRYDEARTEGPIEIILWSNPDQGMVELTAFESI